MKKIIFIVVFVLLIASAFVVILLVKNKPELGPHPLGGYQEYLQAYLTDKAQDAIRQFYSDPVTFPQSNDLITSSYSDLGVYHYGFQFRGVVIDPNDVQKSWEVMLAGKNLQDDFIVVYIKIGDDVKFDIVDTR